MKLPQEVDLKIAAIQFDLDAYEAIVRDCAKVITDQIPYWCAPGQAKCLELAAKDILARYGLEPKT